MFYLKPWRQKECGMIAFKFWGKKNCQPRILQPVKRSLRSEGEMNTLSDDVKLWRTCNQQTYPLKMAKQNPLNREEIIKQGILEYINTYQEIKKNTVCKNWVKSIGFPPSF